jgi:hypothetical protein
VSVLLLNHLGERGLGLVGSRHVVNEDVLRRIGRIYRSVRLVERVVTGTDDRQRRAVRAELRAYSFACEEVRIGGETGDPAG